MEGTEVARRVNKGHERVWNLQGACEGRRSRQLEPTEQNRIESETVHTRGTSTYMSIRASRMPQYSEQTVMEKAASVTPATQAASTSMMESPKVTPAGRARDQRGPCHCQRTGEPELWFPDADTGTWHACLTGTDKALLHPHTIRG